MTDPNDHGHGNLHDAKKKLSELRGRPFDVDKTLADHRAKSEREHRAQKAIEAKLEEQHRGARARRHELRAQEAEKEESDLEEKRLHLEAAKKVVQERKDGAKSSAQPNHSGNKGTGLQKGSS